MKTMFATIITQYNICSPKSRNPTPPFSSNIIAIIISARNSPNNFDCFPSIFYEQHTLWDFYHSCRWCIDQIYLSIRQCLIFRTSNKNPFQYHFRAPEDWTADISIYASYSFSVSLLVFLPWVKFVPNPVGLGPGNWGSVPISCTFTSCGFSSSSLLLPISRPIPRLGIFSLYGFVPMLLM